MTLFRNDTHRDIWLEHHCHMCFHHQGAGCKIVQRALRTGRKPVEWERNPRKNALMQDSIKCNEETRSPPTLTKRVVNEDVPMFDVAAPIDMDTEHA